MAKRKKRNALTMVFLLLALILLIGIYLWYSNREDSSEESEEVTETIDLVTVDTEQLTSLHYIREDADLTLTLKDEVWISEEEPERPINQEYVEAMINAIKDVKADRIVMENPENLEDYGLATPSATFIGTLQDGTTVTVKIGNAAGSSEGYYGLVNEDGIVYLLPIEMGTAFQYSDAQMTALPETVDITAENIYYIHVDHREGDDYELKYNDSGELDNSGSNNYTWDILKPYGKGYTADSSKMSDIQANYSGFNYISCIDYKGEDLSLYGLENPIATIEIGYYKEKTQTLEEPETDSETGEEVTEKTIREDHVYKVYLGDKDETGNYYVRIDGSSAVYTIGSSSVESMLTVDVFDIMNPYVLIPNIEQVDGISIDMAGTTYSMRIDRTTKEKEEGEEETVTSYYFDNKVVEEDQFKELYQLLIATQYDAEIKEEVSTEGIEPVMTLTFHISGGKTVSASFLPYNDSFNVVKKEDGTRFFVDKRKIDDIMDSVSNFVPDKTE